MAANTVIVVGRATTWPSVCSRWLRPKRVKSGMFSDSVAQKPIIAGERRDEDRPGTRRSVFSFDRAGSSSGPRPFAAVDRPPQQHRRHHQHEGRGPVLDRAQQVHAAVDDEDVEPPEEQEATATRWWCGRRSRRPAAWASPGRSRVKNVCSASPPIQAWMPNQPQATSARMQRRQVRRRWCRRRRGRSTGNGMPYFVPGCEFSRIGISTIVLPSRIVKSACHQFMPGGHQARRPACRWGCSAPC